MAMRPLLLHFALEALVEYGGQQRVECGAGSAFGNSG
jgi:hypothetical protein